MRSANAYRVAGPNSDSKFYKCRFSFILVDSPLHHPVVGTIENSMYGITCYRYPPLYDDITRSLYNGRMAMAMLSVIVSIIVLTVSSLNIAKLVTQNLLVHS